MKSEKNVTDPVRAANRVNAQSSVGPKTKQGKSKRVALPVAPAGRLTAKSDVPKERMTKAQANRENSLKSTGPTTPRGKRYSRSNARTHGLYSKELLVSEADRPEFEEMRFGLEAQLQPSTTLQGLAFDYNVVCHWRCKLALRLERPQFARQFQDEQPKNERGEAPDVDPVIERWYGSSRADTRAGIRLLEYAMEEFECAGYFHEDTKAFLRRAFGLDYVPFLEEWNTMSKDAILMANSIVSHCQVFGEIPDTDVKSSSRLGETTKVVVDPMQGRHMVRKLLEEKRNVLKELLVITGQHTLDGKPDAAQSSEFNPRFLADANRELRRALDHYFDLKDKGL